MSEQEKQMLIDWLRCGWSCVPPEFQPPMPVIEAGFMLWLPWFFLVEPLVRVFLPWAVS